MSSFKLPGPLIVDENLKENWRKFKRQFETYLLAALLTKADEDRKIAIFKNIIGEEAEDLLETFNLDEEKSKNLSEILKAFDDYCSPKCNVTYQRHLFFTRKQAESETFDQFLTELKKLAKPCEFGDQEESLIKSFVILGITDNELREELLRDTELNLEKTVKICRTREISRIQAKSLISTSEKEIHAFNRRYGTRYAKNFTPNQSVKQDRNKDTEKSGNHYRSKSDEISCTRCNTKHKPRECPAYGRKCLICNRYNHFAVACQFNKEKHEVKDEQNSKTKEKKIHDVDDIDQVIDLINIDSIGNLNENEWYEKIIIKDTPINVKLDSGAQCNVIPIETLLKITKNPAIQSENVRLVLYGRQNQMETLGSVILPCLVKNKAVKLKFAVVKCYDKTLLGLNTCRELNLIQRVDSIETSILPATKEEFINKYKANFTGIGKLPNPYVLVLKENAIPAVKNITRIPHAIRDKVKAKLDSYESQQIIAKVDEPTDWVNSATYVEKSNGEIRPCLNPADLNRNLKPDPYPIPTQEELTLKLGNKKFFTVIDIREAFLHVQLDERSSFLTTFITPFGKYRWLRLPYGVTVSPQVFQKRISEIFEDLPEIGTYFDDIIIAADSLKRHDELLVEVMRRAEFYNIKFNPTKLQYRTKVVKYLGLRISQDGIATDDDYINTLRKLPEPKNKAELASFLGSINFIGKFIPNLSELNAYLRQLNSVNVEFIWTAEHSRAFKILVEAITTTPTLKIYNPKEPIKIYADASQNGLGACLIQDDRLVYCVSRALTPTEKNYAQIEKELLSICFALEKSHYFVYGHNDVTVYSDHKPLTAIVQKDIHLISSRLQKMRLRLIKYNFKLEFIPGKKNILADLLSRNVDPKMESATPYMNVTIHDVKKTVIFSEKKLQELKQATANDAVLQAVIQNLQGNHQKLDPKNADVNFYLKLKDQLCYNDGLILYGDKIIIPEKMQKSILQSLHQSHLGIEKTKMRARYLMYWKGITKAIENCIKGCKTCQSLLPRQCKEELIPYPLTKVPYERIGVDVAAYGGKYYLVVADYGSFWIDAIPTNSIDSSSLIKILKSTFATHGIPQEMIADNVPFASKEFKKFAEEWEFTITTSSPHYPKSNGLAEKAVGVVKKLLKKSEQTKIDFQYLLLEHRNTPIKMLGYAPAQLLLNRTTRTRLPITDHQLQPVIPNIDKEKAQQHAAYYYNRQTRPSRIFEPGEHVFARHQGMWVPATITEAAETPRSYNLELDANKSTVRRNTVDIRLGITPPSPVEESLVTPPPPMAPDPPDSPPIAVRKGARTRRPPNRLNL